MSVFTSTGERLERSRLSPLNEALARYVAEHNWPAASIGAAAFMMLNGFPGVFSLNHAAKLLGRAPANVAANMADVASWLRAELAEQDELLPEFRRRQDDEPLNAGASG